MMDAISVTAERVAKVYQYIIFSLLSYLKKWKNWTAPATKATKWKKVVRTT
jgi:hypothetical protein